VYNPPAYYGEGGSIMAPNGVVYLWDSGYNPCASPEPYFDSIKQLYGYKDCHNHKIIAAKYILPGSFNKGIASVEINDSTWGCINTSGALLFSMNHIAFIETFHSGTAIFGMKTQSEEGGMGIIDQSGNILMAPIASSLEDAGNCIIAKSGPQVFFLLDRRGNMINTTPYSWLQRMTNDMILAVASGKTGFLDKNGKIVVPFKYDQAEPFYYGFAAVCLNGKWGFINKYGKVMIPIKYSHPFESPNSSLSGFNPNGLVYIWQKGYVDIHGTEYWEELPKVSNE